MFVIFFAFYCSLPLRRAEACRLRWREVDLEGRRILLGAERMKNRTGFVLPLSKPALELLAARKPDAPRPDAFVFPTIGRETVQRLEPLAGAHSQGDRRG